MTYISVDVDLDEIYDSMSKREKQEMLEVLFEDGFRPEGFENIGGESNTPLQTIFEDNLHKIRNGYFQLEKEEFDLITKIANRL